MNRVILAACVLAGCASGRTALDPPDADTTTPPDAKQIDGSIVEPPPDATIMPPPPDAMVVVPPPDAPPVVVQPDAYVCQVMTRQLLLNPVLDLNPSGMGWVQQNIDNAYPIITDDDGIAEHSAPFKAWMGGWAGTDKGVSTLSDVLYQDVAVPAGTTQLRFTGYYEVRTSEAAGSTVYDSAQVRITQTNGTPIATIKTMNNTAPTTAWTAINYLVTPNLSGQTVRVHFTSTNDITDATSFYFDTLALTATYCQ